jgi:hypothetical protein
MKVRLRNVAVSLIGSTLPRVLSVALLTSISNAASLQPSKTRQQWEDLEVITLDPQGNPAKSVYYSYDQLLTLPTVTVKTDRDPNTKTPATYTGIYLSDLFERRQSALLCQSWPKNKTRSIQKCVSRLKRR